MKNLNFSYAFFSCYSIFSELVSVVTVLFAPPILIILFSFFSIKNAGRYANSGLGQLFGCKKDTFYRFMNNGRTLTARYN